MENRFSAWVYTQGGPASLAEKLDCTSHAIRYWLNGETSPHPILIETLVGLGKGAFNFGDVIKLRTRTTPKKAAARC